MSDRAARLLASLERLVRFRELEAPLATVLDEIRLARTHRIELADGDIDTRAWSAPVRAAADELGLLARDVVSIAAALQRSKIEDPIRLDLHAAAGVSELRVVFVGEVVKVSGAVGFDFEVDAVAEVLVEHGEKRPELRIENAIRYEPLGPNSI